MTAVDVIGLMVVYATYRAGMHRPELRIAAWISAGVVVAAVVAEWGMK